MSTHEPGTLVAIDFNAALKWHIYALGSTSDAIVDGMQTWREAFRYALHNGWMPAQLFNSHLRREMVEELLRAMPAGFKLYSTPEGLGMETDNDFYVSNLRESFTDFIIRVIHAESNFDC